MSTSAASELQSSLRELSISDSQHSSIKDISRPTSVKKPMAPKKAPVADSWEDEAESDNDDDKGGATSSSNLDDDTPSPAISACAEGPLDPPPTPISPQTSQPWVSSAGGAGYGNPGPADRRSPNPAAARRPEKQTAVAGRMIAGALGIRAPKRTEEQRAYDRATKEQEIKRRNREREEAAKAKEDEERAKAAVWDM
ncbi:hypothetical protein MW887_002067 [Aspergillus wentii]|nr:hypothetical protein MW887_002067 [Aspergillus wentii]